MVLEYNERAINVKITDRKTSFCNFRSQFSPLGKACPENAFDAASRLLTVSDGTNSAAYSFLANSPLVGQIAIAYSGTAEMTTRYTSDFVHPVRYGRRKTDSGDGWRSGWPGRAEQSCAELSHGVNRLTGIFPALNLMNHIT
jgi:hypothetical protein